MSYGVVRSFPPGSLGTTTVGLVSGSTLAPPTIGSTVGLHPGYASGCRLAPPSVISSVVFPSASSSQFVSSSAPTSEGPTTLLCWTLFIARGCAFWEWE